MERNVDSKTLVAFVMILLGSVIIFSFVPEATKDGVWTHNVLRNWEEYGFFKLHGRLVYNPGGQDVLTQPKIYTGHRAASLYPAYLTGHLTGGAGRSGLPFYLLLTAAVAGAIWRLFERSRFGMLAACATVISPGYARFTTLLDPMAISIWLGLPAVFWACRQLETPSPGRQKLSAVAIALIGCSLLNWTVAFAFLIAGAYLLASPRVSKRRLCFFCIVTGTSAGIVTVLSILGKTQEGAGTQFLSRWTQLYNAYLIGPGGYMGYPMDWSKAASRLVAANGVGLLPLLALLGWTVGFVSIKRREFGWRRSFPFAGAIMCIGAMRNYFAHHPWMAASILITGILFSMKLLTEQELSFSPPDSDRSNPNLLVVPFFFLPCFVYCCAVNLVFRANGAGEDALRSLVQRNTRRNDVIVISPTSDPRLAQNAFRLSDFFDRKVVVTQQQDDVLPDDARERFYVLSASQSLRGNGPVDRTVQTTFVAQTLTEQILGWYRRVITRRAEGDRLDVATDHFLYGPY